MYFILIKTDLIIVEWIVLILHAKNTNAMIHLMLLFFSFDKFFRYFLTKID